MRVASKGRPGRIELKIPRNSSSNGSGRCEVMSPAACKKVQWIYLIVKCRVGFADFCDEGCSAPYSALSDPQYNIF